MRFRRSPRTHWAAFLGRGLVSLWLTIGVVLAVMVAVETVPDAHIAWKKVPRVFDPEGGKPDRRALADTYDGAAWTKTYWREAAAMGTQFAPFVHWRARPFEGKLISVDAESRRRTWSADAAPGAKPIRVWMFGGSGLFGIGARDEHTIASELARRLAPLAAVEVTNFGQPGWVMAQSAIELADRLKTGAIPDVVVFYDGAEDIAATLRQRQAGLPAEAEVRAREFDLTAEARRGDLYSAAVLGFFDRTLKRIFAPERAPAPAQQEDAIRLAERNAALMGATATQMRALAKAYGFDILFVAQPALFAKQTKTAYEAREAADSAALEDGFRAGMAAIATQFRGQADFLDLSSIFDTEAAPVFVDFHRLGETGNATIAEAIAEAVTPLVQTRLPAALPPVPPEEPVAEEPVSGPQ